MSEQPITALINAAEQEVVLASAPMAPPRPSLARKRAAATALALNVTEIPPSIGTRVPSSHSLSSESSDSSDEDNSSDSFKRSRHDSALSVLSDESDTQSSLSSEYYGPSSSSTARSIGSTRREAVQLFVNDSVVGDYKIVGAGREAKAVHMFTNEVYDCRALTEYESLAVTRVVCRLDGAREYYHGSDIDQLRDAVFPEKAEVVEELNGRVVLFTPVYQRTLHLYAQERGVHVSEAELKPIFEQIIRLVDFCHRVGIILRDLKPRKLVIDKNGKIRLAHVCDCVVCDDPNNDVQQEKFGSPAYVPPEVLCSHGRGYSGRAADMWGLGVLFYLLLLGRYPFYDHTPVGVFQKIKQARVVIPPTSMISRHARVVLYNLLKKCPCERPTAEELRYIPWTTLPKVLPSRGQPERILSMSTTTDFLNDSTSTGSGGRSAASYSGSAGVEGGRSRASDSPQSALEGLRTIMMSTRHLLVAARAAMSGTAGVQTL